MGGHKWSNLQKIYKHCATSMLAKLKGMANWGTIADNEDGMALIKQL